MHAWVTCSARLISRSNILLLGQRSLQFPQPCTLVCGSKLHTSYKKQNKSLVIWEDLKNVRHSPTPALTLGLSGLIPFIAAPIFMTQQGIFMPDIAFMQLAYGASILSFLGGVRWGMLVAPQSDLTPSWTQYSWSVTPSLIAWGALLMPPLPGCITCIGGLGVAAYLDLVQFGYPTWFKGLRFVLTFGAVLSLWSSLMCKMLLPEKKTVDSKKKSEK